MIARLTVVLGLVFALSSSCTWLLEDPSNESFSFQKVNESLYEIKDPDLSMSGLLVVNKEGSSTGSALSYSTQFRICRPPNLIHTVTSNLRTQSAATVVQLNSGVLKHTFWGIDGNLLTSVSATLRYGSSSTKALIYVQENKATTLNWTQIGQEFDDVIYPMVVEYFGSPTDIDGNSQVVLLYYDMRQDRRLAGFFYPNDLRSGGNEMELIHMNLLADSSDSALMKSALAHELEHLVNYGQRVIVQKISPMDRWMDEGLACGAQHLYLKGVVQEIVDWYTADTDHHIAHGLSLCVWDDTIVEHYALSYLFFQYLRVQAADGDRFFRDLIQAEDASYLALEQLMPDQMAIGSTFSDILIGFKLATILNHFDGIYGYKNEADIFNLPILPLESDITVSLNSGGSVFIPLSSDELTAFTPLLGQDSLIYLKLYCSD